MLSLIYAPIFVRNLNKLENKLQDEVLEKIELFKNPVNHKQLKVHKLRDHLKDCYIFFVNYRYRVLFSYSNKEEVNIFTIGDHAIYN